jgi:WD40 repeat protein
MAHHLFFSYAHDDKDRLYPIHARMQAVTERYLWIDKVGLRTGVEWYAAIQRAIHESYGVIFAVTQAFITRPFILDKEIPWAVERFQDIQRSVLLHIRFDDAPLPAALNLPHIAHPLDARDGDYERLYAELKTLLPRPTESGHPFIVDWPRLTTFQGRDAQLVELHSLLKEGSAGIKTAGLHGMGGIGKTQLAVEYAHRYRFHYPAGVYWLNAARSWTDEAADLAERLRLKPTHTDGGDVKRQLAAAFAAYLREQDGDALVIADNVENPADALSREIGPKLRLVDLPARLLITTRRQDLPKGFAPVGVHVLPPDEARALLLAARPDALDDPALDAICEKLGYLPLALGLAAAALAKRPAMSPAKFLEHLRAQGVDEIARRVKLSPGELGTPEDYIFLVDVALDWHWGQIGNPDARGLLALAAAYGEAAVIPLARLRTLSGPPDDPDDLEQPFGDALAELRAASLVEDVGGAALRLHALVRDYARRRETDWAARLDTGAGRLVNAYRTPETLNTAAIQRGFGALIADLSESATALPAEATNRKAVETLARLFDWEGHHLREWQPAEHLAMLSANAVDPSLNPSPRSGEGLGSRVSPSLHEKGKGLGGGVRQQPSKYPAHLIQHIRERAHHQGDDALCDACDGWLNGHPHFRTAAAYRFPHDPALIRIFVGHTHEVNAVAVLPDGRRALSASNDRTLRLWDVESGATLRIFQGHTHEVNGVAMLADGRRALSASSDNTLRLWDIETGATLRIFSGHTNVVTAVAALADGRRVLSALWDGTLRLWDVEGGATLRVFAGHTNGVTAVAALADGRRVLSASWDNTLRLWDVESGATLHIFVGHAGWVTAVAALADGQHALSASRDKTLRLWDAEGGATPRTFDGHTDQVTALAVLGGGRRILSASRDKTLRLWDVESGATLRVFEAHVSTVEAVVPLADGRHALSALWDNTLRLWDVESGANLRVFEGHTGWVRAVAVLVDERRALSAADDQTLRVWDVETGATVRTFIGHTREVNAVAALGDGRRALSASADKTLRLWDVETGETLHTFRGHTGSVNAVVALPDGRRALSGSADRTLRLWDVETGETLHSFEGHAGAVRAVVVLPDGRRALSAANDQTLRLWDVESGVCLALLRLEEAPLCLAVIPSAGPGDARVVVGGNLGRVRVVRAVG